MQQNEITLLVLGALYLWACYAVSVQGKLRKIGNIDSFIFALVFTPFMGILLVIASPFIEKKEDVKVEEEKPSSL